MMHFFPGFMPGFLHIREGAGILTMEGNKAIMKAENMRRTL